MHEATNKPRFRQNKHFVPTYKSSLISTVLKTQYSVRSAAAIHDRVAHPPATSAIASSLTPIRRGYDLTVDYTSPSTQIILSPTDYYLLLTTTSAFGAGASSLAAAARSIADATGGYGRMSKNSAQIANSSM